MFHIPLPIPYKELNCVLEAYIGASQTSLMERFAIIVNAQS